MRKLVGLPLIQVGRVGDRAGSVGNHLDAQIHLEPSEAHDFLAFFHALRVNFWVLRLCCVGVDANLVAELAAAYQRIYGSVVDFSGNIPERHFDSTDSAALARVSAKLLDLAENLVELQRILAQNPALEKQGISGARAITDLPQTVHSLVGIDANDWARARARLHHSGYAQVYDLQRRGT